MSTTHDRLPLINEGFAFKKAGERITHSEWNAVIDTFAKCYNNLIIDTDETASTILLALADKAEQTHTHDVAAVKGLSEHIAAALKAIDLSAFVTSATLDTKISAALTSAKASGLFDGANGMDGKDGADGTSAAHSWNGTVLTVTSASGTSSADLKGEKGDKGDDGANGKDGADYILTDDDKSEIAAQVSGDCVSYSKAQALTNEQKETARNNINAVDASLVVSSLSNGQQIPNGEALNAFVDEWTGACCVRYDADPYYLPEEYKARVRNNIGAAAIENWELIRDDTFDTAVGSTPLVYTMTQDQVPLSYKRLKVMVDLKNTNSYYTEAGNVILNLLSQNTRVYSCAIYYSSVHPTTVGRYSRIIFDVEVINGIAYATSVALKNLTSLANTEIYVAPTLQHSLGFLLQTDTIEGFTITATKAGIGPDTRIRCWGLR